MAKRPAARKGEPFPLWRHPNGQWCKKIRGRNRYFGVDQEAALAEYVRTREDLEAGREPRPERGRLPLTDLVNRFLTWKEQRVLAGELTGASFADYHRSCERILGVLGKSAMVDQLRPDDFARLRAAVAGDMAPATLTRFITLARGLFAYAFDAELLDVPVRYGNFFDKPSRRIMRLDKIKKGELLVSAADFWKLHDAADANMRAFLLLGLNAGFGSKDCADLNREHLAAKPGWIVFPRPKTGIDRRCPLWPETVAAIAAVTAARPGAKDPADADAVFLTKQGNRWVRQKQNADNRAVNMDAFAGAMAKLVMAAGVESAVTPYRLRRTFRTVGDAVRDEPALDLIMGHSTEGMGAKYTQRVEDERLEAVVSHVRSWLIEERRKKAKKKPKS